MASVTKSIVFKLFSLPDAKTRIRRSQIPPLWKAFSKTAPFLRRINVYVQISPDASWNTTDHTPAKNNITGLIEFLTGEDITWIF